MTNPTELLNHRYGHNNFNPDIPWSDTLATLLSHRSIRAYLPDALPPGTLEVLIAAAQSASTSSNLQTWSVVAVEDANRKEELSKLTNNQAHIRQSPLFLVWLADLARALASKPSLLLLDEPLGALDALTRIEMQQLLERLWQEQGFTSLLITHDVEEAVVLADRVILIENGQISLNVKIDLPRPRARGDAKFAKLVERILDRVMGKQESLQTGSSSSSSSYLLSSVSA
jgi:hypothetical protein